MEKKIRVAIILPRIGYGGAEIVVNRTINSIDKSKYLIDLYNLNQKGKNIISKLINKSSAFFYATQFSNIFYILNRMKIYKPDIIWAHDNISALLALTINKIGTLNIPIIVTIHATLSERWKEYNKLKLKLIKYLSKKILSNVDAIVAISEGAFDDLSSLIGASEKIRLIRNAIIVQDIFDKANEEINDIEYKKPYILGVGRLVPQKGFDILIEAFYILRTKYKEQINLIILGEGAERIRLEKYAEEHNIKSYIYMPGHVGNPYPYMKEASVFVLSSRWEGLPTVLVEALALGAPVVSTDCKSGPSEILKNGKFGRLVRINDAESLATAILETMHGSMVKSSIEDISPYMAKYSTNEYESLFKELLNKRR